MAAERSRRRSEQFHVQPGEQSSRPGMLTEARDLSAAGASTRVRSRASRLARPRACDPGLIASIRKPAISSTWAVEKSAAAAWWSPAPSSLRVQTSTLCILCLNVPQRCSTVRKERAVHPPPCLPPRSGVWPLLCAWQAAPHLR